MNTLDSFPKSRLFILLFVLTFTTLPGAFSLNAKTTGNYRVNNYADSSTRCNRETRTNILTTSAWSGLNYFIPHHIPPDIRETLHITHYTLHANNLIHYNYDTHI